MIVLLMKKSLFSLESCESQKTHTDTVDQVQCSHIHFRAPGNVEVTTESLICEIINKLTLNTYWPNLCLYKY